MNAMLNYFSHGFKNAYAPSSLENVKITYKLGSISERIFKKRVAEFEKEQAKRETHEKTVKFTN